MRKQTVGLTAACCLLGGLCAYLASANWKLTNERNAQAIEAALAAYEDGLKAPTEAIYFDATTFRHRVAKPRLETLQEWGVRDFLPHGMIRGGSAVSGGVLTGERPPIQDDSMIHNGSFEVWWSNHALHVCQGLRDSIESDRGIGPYLKQHPEVFRKRLRPWVVRLLVSFHAWNRLEACRVLLAMGESSPELTEIVTASLNEPGSHEFALAICEKYGLPVAGKEPWHTRDEELAEWRELRDAVVRFVKEKD